jgi:putative tricarboxylic transport membrane protein
LATFVLFGLYIALLPELGFRISTFLFVLALQVTLEIPRNTKQWGLAVAVAIATSAACHFVFEDYLSVLLPRGTWSAM